MTTGLFKVIKASAGSGKTYSLVKEFLLLVLKSDQPWYYRHILAITFTNAAAAEMKERVLLKLKEFTNDGPPSTLGSEICTQLGISAEVLQKRAEAAFRHMLHNYGQLSILTIDSFTHKLIRSFSRDLHLTYDFNIEIDSSAFLEKLIYHCIENIGIDESLTSYLEKFALENLEEENSWNIRQKLIDVAKKLFADDTEESIQKLDHFSLQDFNKIRKQLFEKNRALENKAKSIGSIAKDILQKHELNVEDFHYGKSGGMAFFHKMGRADLEFPGARFMELATRADWHGSKSSKEIQSTVQLARQELHPLVMETIDLLNAETLSLYELRNLVMKNLYAMGLLRTLENFSQALKAETNILLIADFHKLVHAIVKDNEAPFIYERIGTRYKHILFDEFQDTSSLQWANAIPLVQNALSENNLSLVVGDAKQSIYRWRGGNVEQFIELPKIAEKANPHGSQAFSGHYIMEPLTKNFRSSKEVIQFNNVLYGHIKNVLNHYSEVYADASQETVREKTGYVRVDRSEGKQKKEHWENTSRLILDYVKECIADGYRPGDIAIITRKGFKEGGKIAALLSENNYQVVTRESFLINNSPIVRCIIAAFDIAILPSNHFAAIELVRSLATIHQHIVFEEFLSTHIKHTGKEIQIDLSSFLAPHFGNFPDMVTGDSVMANAFFLLRYFKLEADTGMEFLLEKIKDQCTVKNLSLSDFLNWWHDAKGNLYTSSSENIHAINVLTVHKSKGLQFPVVIYPRFATTEQFNELWINLDEKEFGIPTALVKSRSVNSDKKANFKWPLEFYEEEERVHLDDVNTCYVATTRAEDRLYMIAETGCTKWLSKQIDQILNAHFIPYQTTGTYESGIKEKSAVVEVVTSSEVVRFSGEKFLRPELKVNPRESKKNAGMEHGTLIHMCLAEIQHAVDLDVAVHSVIHKQKLLKKIDHLVLKSEIETIISHPKCAHWFSKESKTMREKELCTADGSILRPDRIVIFDDHVDVIDYKTGIPHPSYEKQVTAYVQSVSDMFQKPVFGYLLYTSSAEVVQVKTGA